MCVKSPSLQPSGGHGDIPPTIEWVLGSGGPAVRIIDQTLLPGQERLIDLTDVSAVCEAIVTLRIRGAPAIGCAGIAGMALAAAYSQAEDLDNLRAEVLAAAEKLAATRPTAVNLFWALERGRTVCRKAGSVAELQQGLREEAEFVIKDDLQRCLDIGRHGAELFSAPSRVLTHCNAGALATAGYGTALGVIRAAHTKGMVRMVWADETRPLLQGARLTAWELHREGIPCTVICDNMAAEFMAAGEVDCVVVGSDRIAANGDVANKIGTYGVAVAAHHHGIAFYVAAPLSTVDFALVSGRDIPIEQRNPAEVAYLGHQAENSVVPDGVNIRNPAFDVTPNELVTAIITEKGIARAPYTESLAAMAK